MSTRDHHPLFCAIVIAGCALGGCRTPPLPEALADLAVADAARDLATRPDFAVECDCSTRPLPQQCQFPCILI